MIELWLADDCRRSYNITFFFPGIIALGIPIATNQSFFNGFLTLLKTLEVDNAMGLCNHLGLQPPLAKDISDPKRMSSCWLVVVL